MAYDSERHKEEIRIRLAELADDVQRSREVEAKIAMLQDEARRLRQSHDEHRMLAGILESLERGPLHRGRPAKVVSE